MKHLKAIFTKTLVGYIILVLAFGTFSVTLAASSQNGPNTQADFLGGGGSSQTNTNSQVIDATAGASGSGPSAASADGSINGATIDKQAVDVNVTTKVGSSASSTKNLTANAASDLLGCTAGSILAKVIAGGINVLIGGITSNLAERALNVPVTIGGTQTGRGIDLETAAHTSIHIFGIPIGVSWDGIAWCIINSVITYIADSTIAWANSGFNGNPAFIQNPQRFFQSVANREAGNFIKELAYDTTGLNVCQPFRAKIAIGLANSYGNSYNRNAGCSIDQIKQNVSNFAANPVSVGTTGGYNMSGYWDRFNASRFDNNNSMGSYILANGALYSRVSTANNSAQFEIGLTKGWLNFKKCEDDTKPETCNIYTPGSLIEDSLAKTLGLPKERVGIAQKFDQVITAVVNNLIRVALNKVLQTSQQATGVNRSGPNGQNQPLIPAR